MQFGYRPGEKVIRNLSFVAEPGKVTALVGPSGGGKSTILNLILRFYEVDDGAITIDGQNIATVSRRSLRESDRLCGTGRIPVPRLGARQHRGRPAGRDRGRDRRRRQGRLCARFHHGVPRRLRHAGRRAWLAGGGRRAPAHRDRPRAAQGRADHPARRGDRFARFRIRARRCSGRSSVSATGAPRS